MAGETESQRKTALVVLFLLGLCIGYGLGSEIEKRRTREWLQKEHPEIPEAEYTPDRSGEDDGKGFGGF